MIKLNLAIAEQVRRARMEQRFQLAEIVERSGEALSVSQFNNLERDKARWNSDSIEAAARGLGIPTHELLRRVADQMEFGDDAEGRNRGDFEAAILDAYRRGGWEKLREYVMVLSNAFALRSGKGGFPAVIKRRLEESADEINSLVETMAQRAKEDAGDGGGE